MPQVASPGAITRPWLGCQLCGISARPALVGACSKSWPGDTQTGIEVGAWAG